MSAPSSKGVCSDGEQKQLSTASMAPMSRLISVSAAISATALSGFDGVSMKSTQVFDLAAWRH